MDVRSWVKKRDEENVKDESLVSILDSGIVKATHRQELVKLAVSGMSQLHNTLYPTAEINEQLTKNIILAFPKLRSMLTNGGYEHFYDRKTNTGFIEFRLKTLRLKLPAKDKKRAANIQLRNKQKLMKFMENESVLLDEQNFKLKVSELAFKMPNDTNKELILKLTDETRANRLNEIKNSDKPMTVVAILKKYPRFKDFNGELISRKFSAVFPENDIFLGTFSAFYAPRILQYCKSIKHHLLELVRDLESNNLKALVLLPELLPSSNYTKRKTSGNTKSNSKTPKIKVVPNDFSQKVVPSKNLLQFIHCIRYINQPNETDVAAVSRALLASAATDPLLLATMKGKSIVLQKRDPDRNNRLCDIDDNEEIPDKEEISVLFIALPAELTISDFDTSVTTRNNLREEDESITLDIPIIYEEPSAMIEVIQTAISDANIPVRLIE
ncbi:hypothetical protein X777_11750 [Ooceraea biroi]|uniref:Uncharacterized protein n=1 Tax=Ooceraea biroi TaxID=2015173 RepID=A0A026W497_OOCBI|nr:hypothetical protein X777_11750 [Ooceraea biroi]